MDIMSDTTTPPTENVGSTGPTIRPIGSDIVQPRPQPLYTVPMPAPGTQGALYFSRKNVSEFLDRWEDMCAEHRLDEETRFRRLLRYCERGIGDYVKSIVEFKSRD